MVETTAVSYLELTVCDKRLESFELKWTSSVINVRKTVRTEMHTEIPYLGQTARLF